MTRRFAAAALVSVLALSATPTARAEQRIATISQGTNMALALTPDGESLIVDLLGRLWLLPVSGGGARQLTPDDEAARHPRVSPDGRLAVYQRLVNGQWDLWLLELASGERRALTDGEHDDREPDFSADGSSVVFVSDRTGHDCLWSIGVASGVLTQLTEEPGDASFPSASTSGEIAYVRREGDQWSLRVLTTQGSSAELLRSEHRLTAPTWRPSGGVLLYNEIAAGGEGTARSSTLKMLLLSTEPLVKALTRAEDVFAGRVAWASPAEYYYAADGQIWRRGIAQVSRQPVHLFAAVTVDAFSPPPFSEPLDAPGPSPVLGVADMSFAADGKTGVFTALGDLWFVDGRDEPRRLTDDEFVDVDASVSPDGDFAVFASDRSAYMDLWHVTLPGGVLTQLTNRPQKAYRPAVAPDGESVAFLETDGIDTWGRARLRLLALGAGRTPNTLGRTPELLADDLLAPGRPVWRDDDDLAVAVRSTPASEDRDATLTVEVGSRRTRLAPGIAVEDAALADDPEPPPLPPAEWRAAAPEEAYVVQVGRLFDGIRTDYLRHVDVHVEGQRITAIVSRGLRPLPANVIDARDATIIPGLIDVHAHHSHLLGERLGRAWLAHGVTTVRELTDDVGAALERAESWASGRRIGPRLIVSPEDGDSGVAGGGAEPGAPPAALPTPVPVVAYSGLRVASSLFRPQGAGAPSRPAAWLRGGHRDTGAPYMLRTSPLNLSYQDVFSTIVQSGAFITSDLAAAAGSRSGKGAWGALIDHPALRNFYTPEERASWLDGAAPTGTLQPLQDNIARLVRAGGRIAAGTEAPTIPYGLGMHLEMALLAEAGIPADQVLRIATASNAMALGLERQVGTLEAGKLADFVVVDGNPLTNLSEAMNVTAVVRGGVWHDRERLTGAP